MKIKIQYKILFLFLVVIIGLMGFTFVSISRIVQSNFMDYIGNRIEKSGDVVNNYIASIRDIKQQNIKAFANIAELNNALDNEQLFRLPYILEKYRLDYDFDSVQLYTTRGEILSGAGRFKKYSGHNYIKHGGFSGVVSEGGAILFVASSITLNRQAIIVGKTVFDDRTASKIKDTIDVNVGVVKNNRIIAQAVFDDQRGKGFEIDTGIDPAKKTIFNNEQGMTFLYFPLNDYRRQKIATVVLGLSTGWLSLTQKQTQNLLLYIVIGGALLSLIIALLFARRLTKPLGQITQWAHKISQGDLEHKKDIRSNDEIRDLADAFTTMIDELKARFARIEKQNIELKKMDELKTDLISNVSHELRTPITTIFGSMEFLMSDDAGDDKEIIFEFYKSVFSEITVLKKIVNNFIMISVIDKDDYYLSDLNMREFFEEFKTQYINSELKPYINEMNIHINFKAMSRFKKRKKYIVNTDKSYLNHALYEMVHNAIIYNKNGGKLTIDAKLNETTLSIIVEDKGVGIAVEHHKKIFDNFYRVDSSRTYTVSGVGLGLATVKMICDKLGYKIVIESEVDKYTRFVISGIKFREN